MTVLKVYNASAGSGKTFTLTQEYLLLLFKNYNRKKYRNILAVTFTNKATEEMKTRIISEVYKLSIGEKSGYEALLKSTFKYSDIQLKDSAKFILTSILHDYSRFNISTIDSFFQVVIRAFTREIGLQAAFNVELNDKKILEKGVELLFKSLDDNHELLTWLLEFSESKIDEGKSWNLKNDISALGNEIFKESFKTIDNKLLDKIQDKTFIKNYYTRINSIEQDFKVKIKELAQESIDLILSKGLTKEDFKGKGSSFANYFYKIIEKEEFEPNKTALKSVDNVESWYTKGSSNTAQIEEIYNAGLNQKLAQIINLYNEQSLNYLSAKAIKKNLYSLAIIVDIYKKVREYVSENNMFLLSDAAKLLNQVISGSDTPFVYEKIGSIYQNYMIDEFQDTSTIQWKNFKNLIINSLSEGNDCLLVGDVKQSIYRWRNSDWSLLANQVGLDFPHNYQKKVLNNNWRSNKNIIEFNNSFFTNAASILQGDYNQQNSLDDKIITSAYEDIIQKVPESNQNTEGYIKFSFFESETRGKWKESVDEILPKTINDIIEQGYNQKDITILVRTKNEGKRVVDVLLNANNSEEYSHKFKIISDESLFINNSASVRLILISLKYLQNENDGFYKTLLLSEYLNYVKNDSELFKNTLQEINNNDLIDSVLPKDFISEKDNLSRLSLYDLVEKLILIFNLKSNSGELPFILTFQSAVYEYVKNEKSDVNSFLTWWDEQGITTTLRASETQDAIRILTIHKAKGLEFDVVLIPYLDWDLAPHKDTIIWCEPNSEPFNEISKLPIVFNKELANTIFKESYFEELRNSYVDNLNLLYVAFTRAKEQLLAFTQLNKKYESVTKVSDIIWNVFNQSIELSQNWNVQENTFEFGKIKKDNSPKISNQNSLKISDFSSDIDIYSKLRLKYNSADINFEKSSEYNSGMSLGNIMHHLFEQITYFNDVELAVKSLVEEGTISLDESKQIIAEISEEISKEPIKLWFDKSWEVLNERTILLKNGDIRRPDRVLVKCENAICIDYKFGLVERNSYIKQMSDYTSFLKNMGYKNVKAYIWYYSLKKIVEV